MIDFIDPFSGIGGFRHGLERGGGFRSVWSCDNNRYANEIYLKHWPKSNHYPDDIRGINPETIPDFDLLCAGFPCQSFSVSGKRKGFQDTRGTLFFEICRIAKAKRPSLLLLENVQGLLSSDKGRTFTKILRSLDELGYWIEWQVLNSKYFGVPQNRPRVFIIGHLRETSSRPIFPLNGEGEVSDGGEESKTAGSLSGGAHSGGNHSDMTLIYDPYNRNFRKDGLSGSLKTNQGSPTSATTVILEPYIKNVPHGHNEGWEKALPNLRASGLQYNELLVLPEIANCVTDGWLMDTRHHSKPMCEYRIRRLTPLECERLQGFPDGWTEGISNSQRYRLLGNAVTVNVIEHLGELIKSEFTNTSEKEET